MIVLAALFLGAIVGFFTAALLAMGRIDEADELGRQAAKAEGRWQFDEALREQLLIRLRNGEHQKR